ncbi:MAG: VWA domain-containing protein [Desulfatitalea sp.]|nr:VWA domain-containing protein [Desulfatitalea sp.]
MNFARVGMLFLFWGVPFLLLAYLYGWRKRRLILERFADRRALMGLVPPGIDGRRRLRAILVLAAALLLVLALAGPQYGYQWQTVTRHGVDLIIALDCSRSMLAQDIQPTRLARAKREIVDLLAMLQGDRVGLVAFSGTAFLQCPLTIDYSAFDLFLNVLTPDYLPLGGTDLTAAVQSSLAAFNPQSTADKAIIVITDGEQTGRGDPEAAAQEAQKAGVKLFCIGVGSAEGVPVPMGGGGFQKDARGQIVMSRLDEALLTRMAVATGGTYVRSVAGDLDLETIYREHIRGEMAGVTEEGGRRQVWADRYQWPLGLAILLLMAALALPGAKASTTLAALALVLLTIPAPLQAGPLQEGYEAYQKGEYDQAVEKFLRGQLDDPDNPQVLYNLGSAYYKKGEYAAARNQYSQALSQADATLKSQLLYNLGNSAFRQGALEEAVKNYKAALQLAPEDSQAKENLAFAEEQLKQQQEQKQQQQQDQQEQKEQQQPEQQRQKQESSDSSGQSPQEKEEQPSAGPPPPHRTPAGQPTPSEAARQPDEGARAEQSASQPQAGEEKKRPAQPAAEQMLNRLKDEPGRALMPRYDKRPVEKDW